GTERDEHEPVRGPDLGPLQHSGVPESFGEHPPPALTRMITATGRGAAQLDYPREPCHAADEQHPTHDRNGQRHDDRGDFHLSLLLEGKCDLQPSAAAPCALSLSHDVPQARATMC